MLPALQVDTPLIAMLQVPWISVKIPPEAVARGIVRAIHRHQSEMIVPFQARVLIGLNIFSPSLRDWIARLFHLESWENVGR